MEMAIFLFFLILAFVFVQAFLPFVNLDTTNLMAILIMAVSSRRLARYTMGMRMHRVFGFLLQDLLFLVFNYFLLTSKIVRLNVLSYPEFYLFVVFAIAFLMERYRGLRLMELVRFKNLIRNEASLRDRQE